MHAQSWVALVAAIVAALAAFFGWRRQTIADRQKTIADSRSEWWRRITWALDQTVSDDPKRTSLGWGILNSLVTYELALDDDRRTVGAIADHAMRTSEYSRADRIAAAGVAVAADSMTTDEIPQKARERAEAGYTQYKCTIVKGDTSDIVTLEDKSSYGDALLYDLYQELYRKGATGPDVNAISDDLHKRYGTPAGELNIRLQDNPSGVWEAAGGPFAVRIEAIAD